MRKTLTTLIAALILGASLFGQAKVAVHENATDQPVIPKEIYGQFAEHLGRCIYDGIWVGKDSPIPNIDGYRKDLVEAIRDLKVPVLRWPGGCFADEYHWMDGIGPLSERPKMINSNWGGTVEDNSFGTHEFLNFCEMLGIEPYISGNVGSGSVEELAKWVEYMTAKGGTMAEKRAANGRKEPWKVKYIGVGNESWGCGGNMTPEFYSDQYKRYAIYCRNYDGNHLYKVASGASDYDYNWTKVLMERVRSDISGLSLHYYSTINWNRKGSATDFTEDEYLDILAKAVEIEEVLRKHETIMGLYDPRHRIDLLLDEWGTWFDVEPGTNPGHLYQQNTMRDAMVAAMSLNIFNKHTSRLKMANIAQMVNVLQSMILTKGSEIVLTPTYHVFKMYNVHQDAVAVPVEMPSDSLVSKSGRLYPTLSVSASKSDALHVSLANPSVSETKTVELEFDSLKPSKVSGEILVGKGKGIEAVKSHNDFDGKVEVAPAPFKGFKTSGKTVKVTLPPASVVTLAVE
ncbi:MAG: alpha-N-arabinofuranosidase [Bacteroidales bacterium]|nr:alpha-N-arabinofuranosidase [Bacteroidales bacterium]